MTDEVSFFYSTIEYDRYGFLKQHDADEDVLVTRATELQRRSRELEIQIKVS